MFETLAVRAEKAPQIHQRQVSPILRRQVVNLQGRDIAHREREIGEYTQGRHHGHIKPFAPLVAGVLEDKWQQTSEYQ